MQWKRSLMVLAVLAFGLAAYGQGGLIPVAPGDAVTGEGAAPDYLPTTVNNPRPAWVGMPVMGDYNILVNAYIQAYARVTVYDNWILFGATEMNPLLGEFNAPARPIAQGNPFALVDVPAGGAGNGANIYDLAGGRVETNSRLNLVISQLGFLTRVTDTGGVWAGRDTRKVDVGPYQLANQFKIKFHGRFLQWAGYAGSALEFTNPDDEDFSVLPYVSPTSGGATNYNTWTAWSTADDVVATDTGWLWPADLTNPATHDPWTGENLLASTSPLGAYNDGVQVIPVIVERGQAQTTGRGLGATHYGDAAAAEWWITERVIRRGLQDISGNYSTIIDVELLYRETPVEWGTRPVVPPPLPI